MRLQVQETTQREIGMGTEEEGQSPPIYRQRQSQIIGFARVLKHGDTPEREREREGET